MSAAPLRPGGLDDPGFFFDDLACLELQLAAPLAVPASLAVAIVPAWAAVERVVAIAAPVGDVVAGTRANAITAPTGIDEVVAVSADDHVGLVGTEDVTVTTSVHDRRRQDHDVRPLQAVVAR